MVKVVEGGQFAATRARFSPGLRTGLHLVAAEATETPRPMAIETAKMSKSFFKFPLLLMYSLTRVSTIIAALTSAPILVVFAPMPGAHFGELRKSPTYENLPSTRFGEYGQKKAQIHEAPAAPSSIAELAKSVPSRGGSGPYVLVEAEEVVGVIAALERLESVVFPGPVGLAGPLLTLLHQEVYIDARVVGLEG